MNNLILYIGASVGILIVGSILGYYTRQTIARKQAGTIEAKLNKLISQAKEEAKETLFKAKEKSTKILEESKDEERNRYKQLNQREDRLIRKEQTVEQKISQ